MVFGACFTAWLVVELAPVTAEPPVLVVLVVQLDTAAIRPTETSTLMSRVRACTNIVISQCRSVDGLRWHT